MSDSKSKHICAIHFESIKTSNSFIITFYVFIRDILRKSVYHLSPAQITYHLFLPSYIKIGIILYGWKECRGMPNNQARIPTILVECYAGANWLLIWYHLSNGAINNWSVLVPYWCHSIGSTKRNRVAKSIWNNCKSSVFMCLPANDARKLS